jgi:hypothetical protein
MRAIGLVDNKIITTNIRINNGYVELFDGAIRFKSNDINKTYKKVIRFLEQRDFAILSEQSKCDML